MLMLFEGTLLINHKTSKLCRTLRKTFMKLEHTGLAGYRTLLWGQHNYVLVNIANLNKVPCPVYVHTTNINQMIDINNNWRVG